MLRQMILLRKEIKDMRNKLKLLTLLALMCFSVMSCSEKKVDEFGDVSTKGAADTPAKVEAPKVSAPFTPGKVSVQDLIGKFTANGAGYAEIKQEGNTLYLRLGDVSPKDFEKAASKNTSLSYRKTNPLDGQFVVDVFKNWIELNPVTIDSKEYLKFNGAEVYIFQDDPKGFNLYKRNTETNQLEQTPFSFFKGDVQTYPNMNKLRYNMVDKLNDLQFFQ